MNAFQISMSVIVCLYGLVLGSFLNVLIYRLPIGLDFKKGSSICTSCNHKLKWYDLFPLFSYIFLGGKCRYCKAKISPQYPIVEALNAILYTCAFIFLCSSTFSLAFFGYCIVISCLIVVMFTDFQHHIIPDSMWIGILIGGIMIYVNDIIKNGFHKDELIKKVIGFFIISGTLLILGFIFSKIKKVDAIGGGDIKLMAAAGFLLGWDQVLLATLFGTLVGLIFIIISTIVMMSKNPQEPKAEKVKKEKKDKLDKIRTISKEKAKAEKAEAEKAEEVAKEDEEAGNEVAFGPHLAVGILFAMFFGAKLLYLYLEYFVNYN